jgi:hypothetical protein
VEADNKFVTLRAEMIEKIGKVVMLLTNIHNEVLLTKAHER